MYMTDILFYNNRCDEWRPLGMATVCIVAVFGECIGEFNGPLARMKDFQENKHNNYMYHRYYDFL